MEKEMLLRKFIYKCLNESVLENEIKSLKNKLRKIDDWFYNDGKGLGNRTQEEWDEKSKEATKIRRKLYQLTDDSYGRTKEEKKKENLKPKGLNDIYEHPLDVPKKVYKWIFKNTSLLTSDATDAVRWSRIINTRDDERYPSGKITIYRAVGNRNYNEIREGDWVTTKKEYAIKHNEMYFNGKGKVISMNVDGKDVLISPTGDREEAIYAPLNYSIDIEL